MQTKELTHAKPERVLPAEFRLLLQAELVKRCKANPRYSLRAFAQFLGIESSHLSKILHGQRPVREPLLTQLSTRLGLSYAETQGFNPPKHLRREVPLPTFKQLSAEAFTTIEDSNHYAILELMKLKGFRRDPKWIAKKLGIHVLEVHAYLERLQKVGLLEIKEKGEWHDRSEGFSTHILDLNQTSAAHRRSQKQILAKAIDAVDQIPIEQRDQSSMMMATNVQKIAEAKRRLQKFRRELCEFLEDCDDKDAVFQLSLSLFPLTEISQGEPNAKTKK